MKISYKEFCNYFYSNNLSNITEHAIYNTIWIEKKWETVGAWNHWTLEISDYEDNIYYFSDLINNEKVYDAAEKILKDIFQDYI